MSYLKKTTTPLSNSSTKQSSLQSFNNITKEECEEKIMTRFEILKDNKVFHNYFSSYDFHDNEKDMLEFWEDIIYYYYDSIFNTFAMKINNILEYCKFQNKKPIGLNNILIHLNCLEHFITEKEINDINFYKKNFPHLYNQNESWSSYFSNMAQSIFKMNIGCNSESNNFNFENMKLEPNQLLIHFQMLQNHCEDLFNFLTEILREEDHEVIIKRDFNEQLIKRGNEIRFNNQYLDLCLKFLQGIKKISLFNVEVNGNNIECIKILKNNNDTVSNKDITIINILIAIQNLNKKIQDSEKQVLYNRNKAKEQLKNKNKKGAIDYLKKAKMYQNVNSNYNNMITTLEQKIMDLKEMETNISTKNILQDAIKVTKDLGINLEHFDEVAEDLKEQKYNQNEINKIIKETAEEGINEEEIEKELNQLNDDNIGGNDGGDDLEDFLPGAEKGTIILDNEKEKNNVNKE